MLLSCLSGGRNTLAEGMDGVSKCSVIESSGNGAEDTGDDFQRFGILPARTVGYSGENINSIPSVRSTNSNRRVQFSGKAPFRVVKDGKVIDRHNFYTFQTDLKQFPCGIHSIDRYIHSLCQLLI